MVNHIKVLLNAAKLGCVTCPSNPNGQERYNFAMENKIEYKYDCSMDNCSRYVAIKEVERQIEFPETEER